MPRKMIQKLMFFVGTGVFVLMSFGVSKAQMWNANAGGYNGGYGQVYSSFGMALATKNLQDSMNMTLQQSMMRMAMEKQSGKKAVVEAEANAARRSGKTPNAGSALPENAPIVRNYAVFKPDAGIDTGKLFAETLGETAEEQRLIKQIYAATKTAFEKQVAPKGWKNNYAAGLTFFIVTATTVYHDAAEPSDEAVNRLYKALNQVIDENAEFGKIPNRDKQEFYNKMIGFSGLILATYTEGKQNNDAATVKAAGQLAGVLIEMILKTPASKIRFENDSLVTS